MGRLLPGIVAWLEPVPGIEEGGRLWVRGPNVMLGYLRAVAPGVLEPPRDGWYDTGDIVTIDPDGFVAIRGRAKRFAKIGGEMVSLAAAEVLAGAVWDDAAHAVLAVPDARKGEKLLLVTTQHDAEPRALLAAARTRGVAEIQVPRDVLVVDKLPMLGAGKIDYPAVQRLVEGWGGGRAGGGRLVRAGGETGIRTLGTLSRTHAFQACALSRSAISPATGGRLIPDRAADANPKRVPAATSLGAGAKELGGRQRLCGPKPPRSVCRRVQSLTG